MLNDSFQTSVISLTIIKSEVFKMNKTTKVLAVFLTAGLLLAGCAQKEGTKSTSPSSTKATSKATSKSSAKEKTKESSTDESKKEDALAGAQKTVLETSDEAGKSTITLY